MIPMHKVFAGALLAGSAILAATSAWSTDVADDTAAALPAPGPGFGPGRGPGAEGPGHLFRKLGLSADQQASIKAIMTAAKPQMKSLHEQMRANHLKMMQTKPDDPNYGNVVAEVAQANATLASRRTTQGAELRAQMYAVLTPAQKTQLATLEAQRASQPHHGRWGHRPPDAE